MLTPQAGDDTNRCLFSTKEFDSRAELYYFGGRYYDPEVGRWLTQDPLGFVNGPNMYLYCLNNPLNFVDADGLFLERVLQNVGDFLSSPDIQSLAAVPLVGAEIEAVEEAIEAEQIATSTAYRYVGSTEAQIAANEGYIPNVNRFNQPKNIFYTTDAPLNSGSQAQSAYNLSSTPTYRLSFSTQDVRNIYGGNVEGGSGTELVTRQVINGKIKVDKLSQ